MSNESQLRAKVAELERRIGLRDHFHAIRGEQLRGAMESVGYWRGAYIDQVRRNEALTAIIRRGSVSDNANKEEDA